MMVLAGAALPALGVVPATAPAHAEQVYTIEDGDIGTSTGQVSYTGNWTQCGDCYPNTPDGSYRFSHDQNASATVRFEGTALHFYGVREPQGGVMSVQLDNRSPATIDTYSPTSSVELLFSAAELPDGAHTLTVTNTGQRHPDATSTAVSFERLEAIGGQLSSTQAQAAAPGTRSGHPWLSGANGDPRMAPADLDSFCSSRGSACDVALLFVPRDDWLTVSEPLSMLNAFTGWPGRLVIALPAFPNNVGASLGTCATGAYDGYFRTFGATLQATGRQDSFIQLAWEPNGDWFGWSATDPAAYISCFRHISEAIKSATEPDPSLCWCLNGGLSQNPPGGNPLDIYPGDEWVDVVGLSAYDHYQPSYSQQEFDAKATAPGGLTWAYDFARSHGKMFGVSEWGVASGGGGGGDNPDYISRMRSWFEARAGQGLAFEIYYNSCDPNNVTSNLFRPAGGNCVHRNAQAAERYAALW